MDSSVILLGDEVARELEAERFLDNVQSSKNRRQ